MKILLTGKNGFLGKFLYAHFVQMGQITSIIRNHSHDNDNNSEIYADLSKDIPVLTGNFFKVIIHAAGKAHAVPQTVEENEVFYQENLAITQNLIAALNNSILKPKYFIFISSVAVYGLETGQKISEDTDLVATDAYGLSKIRSEQILTDWCRENNIILTILRLPLIAGDNPPGNLGAMINAINKGRFPLIDNGRARRSMIVAHDIPIFIEQIMNKGGIYHLTDGYDPSFKELAQVISKKSEKRLISLPRPVAYILAKVGDFLSFILRKEVPFNSRKLSKMTASLTFSNVKVIENSTWKPTPVLTFYQNNA